jgi:hypothetical protein
MPEAYNIGMEYFLYSKKHKALKKSDIPKLKAYAEISQTILKYEVLDNDIIISFELTWLNNDEGLLFELADRNTDYGESNQVFNGYWVYLHEKTQANSTKAYKVLYGLCQALDFVYEDPQRGKINLNPIEFVEPKYSEQELEKIEHDYIKYSSETTEKLNREIKEKSLSTIYLLNSTKTSIEELLSKTGIKKSNNIKLTLKDSERWDAEELAKKISITTPTIYTFIYEYSGSIVCFCKGQIAVNIDCDSNAKQVFVDAINSKLLKEMNIDETKLKAIVKEPVSEINELVDKVLALTGLN